LVFRLELLEHAVVEHRAVLVDLEQRGAFVRRHARDHLLQVLCLGVDRARDESRFGAERE
jgi:hypothetical protein